MAFCKNCGNAVSDIAKFCSTCGTPTAASSAAPPVMRPLVRAREGRQIAGVCRGLANTYGWDISMVRIITVLLGVVCCPIGEVAYVAGWLLIPEEPLALPSTTTIPSVEN